jgi:hypothetical protein
MAILFLPLVLLEGIRSLFKPGSGAMSLQIRRGRLPLDQLCVYSSCGGCKPLCQA